MLRSNTFVHRILKTATELRKQKPKCLNDDNVVKDDGLRDREASEDTDDLDDDDAEDVTEDNDNLGNVDVADH